MHNGETYVVGLVGPDQKRDMEKLLGEQNAKVDIVETFPELVALIQQRIPSYIVICCGQEHPRAVEQLIDVRKIIDMDHVHILVFFSLPKKEDILKLLR